MPQPRGFTYSRRVHFSETDMAGIVHFSVYFRYMEEAEHALWRAADLKIEGIETTGGWPRVSAGFDYKTPLRFGDEFDVVVRIGNVTRRSFRYDFSFSRGGDLVGNGFIVAVCSSKEGGRLHAIDVPQDMIARLKSAAAR